MNLEVRERVRRNWKSIHSWLGLFSLETVFVSLEWMPCPTFLISFRMGVSRPFAFSSDRVLVLLQIVELDYKYFCNPASRNLIEKPTKLSRSSHACFCILEWKLRIQYQSICYSIKKRREKKKKSHGIPYSWQFFYTSILKSFQTLFFLFLPLLFLSFSSPSPPDIEYAQ